jgi:hypothetical protein
MSNVLHLPARPDTAIACDMSTAPDTPDQRFAEYRELFQQALLRRERRPDGVVFAFRVAPGTRDQVDDLARREHACCPFLEYRVETAGDEVIWTVANPVTGEARANVDAILDAFHALPDDAGSDLDALLARLADGGLAVRL